MKQYDRALVLGLGSSGRAAAELLLAEGCELLAADQAEHASLQSTAAHLASLGAEIHLGGSPLPERNFDVCILSPGIRMTSEWVKLLESRQTPIISELELGWSRRRCPVLAITGSNGKSTLVQWVIEAMERSGLQAIACGNCAPPISSVVRSGTRPDWLVVEVSSFQLETVNEFQPDIGLLLNLQPNHLDRHNTFEEYTKAKARMFNAMKCPHFAVVPTEWKDTMATLSDGSPCWITFGSEDLSEYRVEQKILYHSGTKIGTLDGTPFGNPVMAANGAAGIAALNACGISTETALEAAKAFAHLPHRFQLVTTKNAVQFIDDSKATNLAAMSAALRMSEGPVRLIAGGLAKEKDYASAKEVLAQKAVNVYLIGNAAKDLYQAWSDVVPCAMCGTLDTAVKQAWEDAGQGDVILLSPGCASFDQFRSFEERGDHFAGCTNQLTWEAAS